MKETTIISKRVIELSELMKRAREEGRQIIIGPCRGRDFLIRSAYRLAFGTEDVQSITQKQITHDDQ